MGAAMSKLMPLRRIGLTGGIGMGKTTVSNYLATHHHLPVLDADVYAREAVQPGSAILTQIGQRYGDAVLQADGSLNRSALAQKVFNDPAERRWLEAQIHPFVRDRLQAELCCAERDSKLPVVLVIPLLFETGMTDLSTEIWVVRCSAAQQQARLAAPPRNLTADQIQARIASQWPIAQKLAQADVILDNSTTLAALFNQVDQALAHPQTQA